MPLTTLRIPTSRGVISGVQSAGQGLPILFIHGAAASAGVFCRQFDGALAAAYRLIAIDLPGHGDSPDAAEPAEAYTIEGFAATVGAVIDSLNIDRILIVGWSLGGHITIDLMTWHPAVAGAMIMGAPPIPRGPVGLLRGFHLGRDVLLASKPQFNDAEAERFLHICCGEAGTAAMLAAIKRADGRARRFTFNGLMRGTGIDQKRAVEQSAVPTAVVNGVDEPFARLNFVTSVNYGNLWEGRCHIIHGAGHAPFLEQPEIFNALLAQFAGDVAAIDGLRRAAHKAFAAAG